MAPLHNDLLEPYFDKYYEVIYKMIESTTISQAKATQFNSVMCPLILRMDPEKQKDDLEKVTDLLKFVDKLEKEKSMALSAYKNFFIEQIYFYHKSKQVVCTI